MKKRENRIMFFIAFLMVFAFFGSMYITANRSEDKKTIVESSSDSDDSKSTESTIIRSTSNKMETTIGHCYVFQVSEYERSLLEAIVFAEAGTTEDMEGKIAIAAEVLNRMGDSQFPDTVEGVLFQAGQYYNGNPMWYDQNGEYRPVYESDITDDVREAVDLALQGADPTEDVLGGSGALFHYNPDYTTEVELEKREHIKTQVKIGSHIFYRVWDK